MHNPSVSVSIPPSPKQSSAQASSHYVLPQPQVNYASSYAPQTGHIANAAWLLDSGATNHVTAELDNLTLQTDYKGKGKLAVGNGSLLSISHIGNSIIHIPAATNHLKLSKFLRVPQTKNLLSISQFTNDNKVFIEFHSDCCLIKDKCSRKTLARGELRNGLYQLNLSSCVKSGQASFVESPAVSTMSSLQLSPLNI